MNETQRVSLIADVQRLIDDSGADTVSIAHRELASGEEIFLRPDEILHPASTIKLSVLVEVFRQAAAGTLDLEERLPIVNRFYSSLDGSPFELSVDDDSEQTLYGRIGETETIFELARLMMVRSSNLGTNLLMDRMTAESVNATMHAIGTSGLFLRNKMMDMKAFHAGKTNLGTARALCTLLTLLGERKLVSHEASDAMLSILLGTECQDRLRAGLPQGLPVAHKTGSISNICHDAGIIYPSDNRSPYVLVVMTRGIEEMEEAERLIAAISRRFYAA